MDVTASELHHVEGSGNMHVGDVMCPSGVIDVTDGASAAGRMLVGMPASLMARDARGSDSHGGEAGHDHGRSDAHAAHR